MGKLKLAVSNIAWYPKEIDNFLKLLASLKCEGVELAINMLWDEPVASTMKQRRELREKIRGAGLELVGFHALLYTRPDLHIFRDEKTRQKTLDYLARSIDLCSDLEGKILVFGSARSRDIGELSNRQAYQIAVDFFRAIGKKAKECNVTFCIEPLGPGESNFICSSEDGFRLVNEVNSAGFALHLDSKAMVETKEDFMAAFQRYAGVLKHFHISERKLLPPGSNKFDHSIIGRALAQSAYSNYVSIEMKRGPGEPEDVIQRAVSYARKNYFLD